MLKKLLMWWVVIALLFLTVRVVIAVAMESQTDRRAIPAVVFFHKDSAMATYIGWVDIVGDTVVVFMGIQNGRAVGGLVKGHKSQVDSIVLLRPVQTARMKPRVGGT